MKIFSAQLKGTTIVVSGSTASITGSFTGSIAGIDINETNQFTASTIARLSSIETISSSNDSRVNSLEAFSSSIFTTNTFTSSTSARLNSIETISASNIARLTSLESTSASVDTLNTTQNSRLTSLEIKTGSLATTGSNTFIGTQTITGSLFISSDLVVQGSSSLQNITASAVSIGTNIVNLNTANPAIRYAGLVIGDSGSVGGSGSFLYDSVQDEMLFIHRGDSSVVTSSVALMGPETYDNLGNETYPTLNIIQKGTGKEHLVDSCIFDNGTTVCINANLKSNSNACITSICSPNFIGGTIGGTTGVFSSTISGTDIYASNVSCSPVGCFTTLCGTEIYTPLISVGGTTIRGVGLGNRIGIATSNPLGVLSIGLGSSLSSLATYSSIEPLGIFNMFYTNSGTYPFYLDIAAIGDTMGGSTGGSSIRFLTHCGSANAITAERMRITSCGNVVIGNTTPLGGLTVSEFIANDCNDSISLFYRGTTGAHESLVKFYDFRCQINASIGNNLHDDTSGSPRARLVFKTSNGGAPIERMRIDACGKVGIGTNSPCSLLHIVDTSANATTLTIGENGEVPTIKAGGCNTDLRIEAVGGGGFLEFATNNTVRFRTLGTGETNFTCQICTPGISITSNPIGVEYLIIAGGGGGGWDVGGGGGAGGVLNNSTGIWPGTYNIGIGGGGAGAGTGAPAVPNNGFNTYAIGLMAIGGGGGGNYSGGSGLSGGSGGGGAGYGSTTNAGFGMKGQGFEGGCGINVAGNGSTGGAGGGAGAAGASSINNNPGCVAGGTGIISTIIGEYRSYGCGGRGGGDSWTGNQAGRTNTGDGGDGAGVANGSNAGSNGGSGLTILKMRNTNSATFSGGLTTYTCTHVYGYNIYVVTAGAGTVTIS